ncbi:MAG TPA: TonB-dependent receptor [Rhizomicrobium sp.]|jgi:outer membrane receptor protein involved in Fe transport
MFFLRPTLAAMLCAVFAMPAMAQDASESVPENIEVSASRISLPGFEAPTPVTVIGADKIARDAKIDIGDLIRETPSMGASPSLNNGGNAVDVSQGDAGLDTVNLRNLGLNRTLVLFDGQRVVSSNLLGGGVDLSTLPTTLVKRVDVVTGGASAAWGSDAVAGVVNLILDKQFEGAKANLTLGDTTDQNQRKLAVEGAWGTGFDGDRGHVVLAGNYTTSPDAVFLGQAGWWQGSSLVQNPAYAPGNGQPLFVHADHVGSIQVTQGGLVAGNTAGGAGSTLAANALTGLQFGANGAVSAFNPGTIFGTSCYNGCTNNERTGIIRFTPLAVPYHHGTVFAYASYDVAPDITASLQLNYGLSGERSLGGARQTLVTVRADNAYLPTSIASAFGTLSNGYNAGTGTSGTATAPAQALLVATENANNMPANDYKLSDLCQTVGAPCNINDRALTRGVFTLEGRLGDDWRWTAYIQHSGVRETQRLNNDSLTSHYNFATDAVKVTAANVGTSGLPIGSVQCRALLLGNAAAAGCQPLDIFGTNVASQAAQLYVNPGQDPNSGILDQELIALNQDVVSGSMQGVLPWQLPAGPVAVAFGAEYRHEQGGVIEANALGAAGQWGAGNFVPYRGQYHVEEGFAEVNAPILRDTLVESLDFNAAGRITSYSTSGEVETWKLGLTSQLDDNIRLRSTWSLDIRAPQISELFSPGTLSAQYCSYPLGAPQYACYANQGGNPNLQPEKAVTVSGGAVFTPVFLPGFTLSADWYSIDIHDAIDTVDYQTTINRCLLGQAIYCPQLVFANGAAQPTQVNVFPLNSDVNSTSGLDVAASYTHPLFDGSMSWELNGNYTDQQTRTALGVTYDSAGALGASPDAYASGIPKLRAVLAATYSEGPWSLTAQGRFIGAARLTNGPEGVAAITSASLSRTGVLTRGDILGLVDDNDIPAIAYLDLRAAFRLDEHVQFYGAIDNLMDTAPPQIVSTSGGTGTNAMVYDALGRAIRLGVRVND